MDHDDIWRAIDTLAAEHGLSASGLARRAGLDPTTFNPSKRRTSAGRARWPGTEVLAQALHATGTSLEIFARLVAGERAIATPRRTPADPSVAGTREREGSTDGRFAGGCWQAASMPGFTDPGLYALKMTGGSMQPTFHDGDLIVVSPLAPIEGGNLVVARTAKGDVMARRFLHRSTSWIDFGSLDGNDRSCRSKSAEILWVHRILWSSR